MILKSRRNETFSHTQCHNQIFFQLIALRPFTCARPDNPGLTSWRLAYHYKVVNTQLKLVLTYDRHVTRRILNSSGNSSSDVAQAFCQT